MTKDEALDLALEALDNSYDYVAEEADRVERMYGNYPTRQGKVKGLRQDERKHMEAITAIKQARALDKKAEENMIYKTFEQWKIGNVLEHGVSRIEYYSEDQLDLVEMGWNYGYDAGRAVEQALDKKAENARELGLDYEPVQEPVAWVTAEDVKVFNTVQGESVFLFQKNGKWNFPLYTTPPAAPVLEGRDWSLLEATQESLREHMAEIKRLKEAQPAVPDAMTSADIQEHIEYVAGWNDCRAAMLEILKARGNT